MEPVWSPNGQAIAYVSEKREQIAVVPVSGGVTQYVANAAQSPAWSPDSRTLVFSAAPVGKINLWLASLDGASPRLLTHPGTPPGDHRNAIWLADGRHIVFSAFFPSKGPAALNTGHGPSVRFRSPPPVLRFTVT